MAGQAPEPPVRMAKRTNDSQPRPSDEPDKNPVYHSRRTNIHSELPIAVWQLGHHESAREPAEDFASRVAERLVHVYARPGESVADLDGDPILRYAVVAAGCTYLDVQHQSDVSVLGPVAPPVRLIVVRWPRAAGNPDLLDLRAISRLLLPDIPSLVTTVRPDDSPRPSSNPSDDEQLVAAAHDAGLHRMLQIVTISAPSGGDRFLYYSTQAEAEHLTRATPARSQHPTLRLDLFVFSPNLSHHD
ncbi:hypothetical protein [Cryptosporangium phraense]|uniref:Uncharacterized protein n=1 Tax=Cryptosporangium phraense TaxID=2593070 RepID=A0A545ANN4_9ACTN|nr:hypothetical protein [Cryptosporangium phraense]TQS42861.1 hypothetical protein FL583_22695 [Cryptosporangium phraense]